MEEFADLRSVYGSNYVWRAGTLERRHEDVDHSLFDRFNHCGGVWRVEEVFRIGKRRAC